MKWYKYFCKALSECGNSKLRRLRLIVPALFSNSKPSLPKNSPSRTQRIIHLPVHPPTSLSNHSGAPPRKKKNTKLEITGNYPLTACQPQTPWRKTYLPLPCSDSLLKRFQSDPMTQSWFLLIHNSGFK
ncbi:hypothetical protein ATANTOWER_027931 [Ataeniobius toweri]|uniref:Uncharacterized protein n=1 Tax=Ataeniobius toweri TaxID=208326 RepID=A0ABU7AKI2_9TELE|nr:hypothetical protein [Ataeniobius toweri]